MLRPRALDHVGLTVTDMNWSLRFYCEVLGLELLRRTARGAGGIASAVLKVGEQEMNVFSDPRSRRFARRRLFRHRPFLPGGRERLDRRLRGRAPSGRRGDLQGTRATAGRGIAVHQRSRRLPRRAQRQEVTRASAD